MKLESGVPNPNRHESRIPPTSKRAVFRRDGGVCQMCGAMTNDSDPCDGTTIRLKVHFIIAPECGGGNTINNLRTICSCCSEGLRGVCLPKPDRIHLMSQIRRVTIDDQQAVLGWLLTKFGLVAHKKI